MSGVARPPPSIDAYLAGVAPERRAALSALRGTIRRILPRAEECIRYGMPAFRVEGAVVAGFLATSGGCSYYPFSGRTLATLAPDLARYDQTRGALHFGPERPRPATLVRKLLRTRLAEVHERPLGRGSGARARPARPARGGARRSR